MFGLTEGSNKETAALAAAYFVLGLLFTLGMKFLTAAGVPGMESMVITTMGGVLLILPVIVKWPRHFTPESGYIKVLGVSVPREFLYIVPSGVCAACIIPTTSLLYTFGFTVMVAQTFMRGGLMVGGRVSDQILIWRGISTKKIRWQEEVAWIVAVAAVATNILFASKKDFAALTALPVLITIAVYLFPYTGRLYAMGWFKATGKKRDMRAFTVLEEIVAVITLVVVVAVVFILYGHGFRPKQIVQVVGAFSTNAPFAILVIGALYGASFFPSMFLFLRKGTSMTANTTINRVVSLIAGSSATFLYEKVKLYELIAVVILLVALGFQSWGEYLREQEEKAAREGAVARAKALV